MVNGFLPGMDADFEVRDAGSTGCVRRATRAEIGNGLRSPRPYRHGPLRRSSTDKNLGWLYVLKEPII